nr:MAG TPA: hypothetical protein [Caudoviricetes sp.]
MVIITLLFQQDTAKVPKSKRERRQKACFTST